MILKFLLSLTNRQLHVHSSSVFLSTKTKTHCSYPVTLYYTWQQKRKSHQYSSLDSKYHVLSSILHSVLTEISDSMSSSCDSIGLEAQCIVKVFDFVVSVSCEQVKKFLIDSVLCSQSSIKDCTSMCLVGVVSSSFVSIASSVLSFTVSDSFIASFDQTLRFQMSRAVFFVTERYIVE